MRASKIAPKPIEWLWHPYIPLGKVSVLAGQMGQAKSLFTVWLADYTTNRRAGGVVMLSGEDDAADTLRPRLEAAGADLDRVEIAPRGATLGQLPEFCDGLPNARLITIDPLTAYLPSRFNSWKDQDVRLALGPVQDLAEKRSLAVVLILHLNRRTDGDPLARISESQGVPRVARSVMMWGPSPNDPDGDQGDTKVLVRPKVNLTRASRESATFVIQAKRLTNGIEAPFLVRGENIELDAGDMIADQGERTALEEAMEWLRDFLADGPKLATKVYSAARAVGIKDRTLERAKSKLHAKSQSKRDLNGITEWTWERTDSQYLSYTNRDVGDVGDIGDVARSPRSPRMPSSPSISQCGLDPDAELERLAAKGLL